jgi:flagellin-like hook-associated protein FlgL
MAINDVSLTAGMRANLLALQDTVNLLNRTQSRLSTGKKVNTAIDNPVSFFASQALTSRASVIDSLKDAMGQAVQTITSADKGIKAITSMIEQAKGIAQSALSAAEGSTATQDVTAAVEYSAQVFGTASVGGLSGAGDGETIIIGAGTANEVTFTEGIDWDNTDNDSDAGDALALAITTEGTYTATNNAGVVTISLDGVDIEIASFTGTAIANIDVAVVQAPEPEVAATVYTIGGETFTAGVDFDVEVDPADTAANLVTAVEAAGVGAASNVGAVVTVVLPSTELESLETQYNTLRTQLTELAEDSGYKGKNLLSDDDLVVKFEGTTLTVEGFDASAAGLGITEATWTIGGSIDADVNLLDAALVTLRQESSKMSGNLSIITVRQEFSTNMINTLTEGADKLTLADTNEEGANMLMLQTRQSLSTTALSLSAQAAQSVLRLFQ